MSHSIWLKVTWNGPKVIKFKITANSSAFPGPFAFGIFSCRKPSVREWEESISRWHVWWGEIGALLAARNPGWTGLWTEPHCVKHIRLLARLMHKAPVLCRSSQEMPWEILDLRNKIATGLCTLGGSQNECHPFYLRKQSMPSEAGLSLWSDSLKKNLKCHKISREQGTGRDAGNEEEPARV